MPPAPNFSNRSQIDDTPSPLAALLEAAAAATDGIDLTLSNPTRAGLSYAAFERVWASSKEGPSRYEPDPLGLPAARAAVARHWPGEPDAARADRVLLLPSSSEAYDYVFTLLCDEGDDVLVPEPSYPLLSHLARYANVTLTPYRLAYDGGWHIDLQSVAQARGPRTRAIVLVSPNNPTGSYTSADELAALAALGLPLVSDEVFARYELSPSRERPKSALGATDALTFCMDGLSKSAGLPQLKLSWMGVSGPEPVVREAWRRLTWLADTYLPVNTNVQEALPALLDAAVEFRGGLLARLRANRDTLAQSLSGSAATLLASEGGWYAMVRLPDLASEDEWVLGLWQRARVVAHPGYFYDLALPGPHLVLSLLAPEAVFAHGARAIRAEVERRANGQPSSDHQPG